MGMFRIDFDSYNRYMDLSATGNWRVWGDLGGANTYDVDISNRGKVPAAFPARREIEIRPIEVETSIVKGGRSRRTLAVNQTEQDENTCYADDTYTNAYNKEDLSYKDWVN